MIRNQSSLLLALPAAYARNNPSWGIECWSDPKDNLLAETCSISYMNGSYYLVAPNISINKNQYSLVLNARLKNPVLNANYNFTADLFIQSYKYANTGKQTVAIYKNAVKPINSLSLVNSPQQSASDAYYMLRVPSYALDDVMQITFPPEFSLDSGL